MEQSASAGGMGEGVQMALVAGSAPAESGALAAALGESGYRVICVSTPLEMIHHLEHRRGTIDLIVLGSSLGRHEGDELASFLAEAHPELRRVLVARPGRGVSAKSLLGSVLEKPWIDDLARSARSRIGEQPGGEQER